MISSRQSHYQQCQSQSLSLVVVAVIASPCASYCSSVPKETVDLAAIEWLMSDAYRRVNCHPRVFAQTLKWNSFFAASYPMTHSKRELSIDNVSRPLDSEESYFEEPSKTAASGYQTFSYCAHLHLLHFEAIAVVVVVVGLIDKKFHYKINYLKSVTFVICISWILIRYCFIQEIF